MLSTMCLLMTRNVHVDCNLNCLLETEGLLKVTHSHVHCKCGNVLETVQDAVIVAIQTITASIVAYQIAAIPMTLRDIQRHSPTASFFMCDFSYSCAAVDKISTDIVRRAVPLR